MDTRLVEFLEEQYQRFHNRDFISTDPLQIPHRFERKEDIEISGFLTASIAWGKRSSIIKSADRLMHMMDNSPYEFLMNTSDSSWDKLGKFVHRTFQPPDVMYFMDALRRIYTDKNGLEGVFTHGYLRGGIIDAIAEFRDVFMQWEPLARTQKHVADPRKGSAAKRLNLFLMWMCRKDDLGIHFGIWDGIAQRDLVIPLDVHVGKVARSLGLLKRNTNDWKAAVELTSLLKEMDFEDPTRFDFSLFCTGLEAQNYGKQLV